MALSWGASKASVGCFWHIPGWQASPHKLIVKGPWGLLRSPCLEPSLLPQGHDWAPCLTDWKQPLDTQIEGEWMLALSPSCVPNVDRVAVPLLRHQASLLPGLAPEAFPTQSPYLGSLPLPLELNPRLSWTCLVLSVSSFFRSDVHASDPALVFTWPLHCFLFFAWDLASALLSQPSQGQMSGGSESLQQEVPCLSQ